jgi:hypothetical protein
MCESSLKADDTEHLQNMLSKQWLMLKSSSDFDNARKMVLGSLDEFDRACKNLDTLFQLGHNMKNKREFNILFLATFLWAFEGFYLCRIDLVCLILVLNDHDLYDSNRRRYVTSLEDIGKVDMPSKFSFLEKHGFDVLYRKQDKQLRDRIAHHDFSLDKNDNVIVDGQIIDINRRYTDLIDFIRAISVVLGKCWGI